MAYTFDPAVKAEQQALNAKGANISVDGFLGPQTLAARAKYSAPTTTPTAPSTSTALPVVGGAINPNGGEAVPPKLPTTVVSTAPAVSAANQAKTAIATTDQQKATALANTPSAPVPEKPTPPTPPVLKTPEQLLAEQPAPGMQKVYSTITGQESEIPQGTVPPGYSTQNPLTRQDVQDTVTDQYGTKIVKFSDGTYGRFDINGNYVQGTAEMFSAAKRVNDANTALDNLKNGIYSSEQQSQIDNIKNMYSQLMDKQADLNKRITGGTVNLGVMSGISGSAMSQGAVDKSVQDGITAITKLQNDRDNALVKLKQAFQADDMDLLKSAYDQYNQSQKQIQDNINLMSKAVSKASLDSQKAQEKMNKDNALKYDVDIPTNATFQEMMDALDKSPKYKADKEVAAELNPEENKFMADMAMTGVPINNLFPSLGIGAAGVKNKIPMIKSMVAEATRLGLTPQQMATSIMDKQAKVKTYTALQKQGSLLAAQELKVESDFDLVKSLGSKVPKESLQGAAPALQAWINTGTLATTNNPALNNWLGALTTSLTNYARVVYGQTGAAGVTQGANSEVQNLLKKGLSVETVNSYIDNVAKPEMKNTIGGYDTSLKSLQDHMNAADGTVNANTIGIGGTNTNTQTNTNTNTSGSTVTSASGKTITLPN